MITVAIDAATSRCSVAASDGTTAVERHVDGARHHATAIVALLANAVAELDATPAAIGAVLTGDGPGSFTGLRVVASVAKALTWHRPVAWRTAPSLLLRASAHRPAGGGIVVALSDALRGELYAGVWRVGDGGVESVVGPPRVVTPAALGDFGPCDAVVGSVPAPLREAVEAALGHAIIGEPDSLPDARALLALAAVRGGTSAVADPAEWQPDYGRQAEAQVVWERTHGQPLPTSSGLGG